MRHSRREDLVNATITSNAEEAVDLFLGRVIPVTIKVIIKWVHYQTPGVIESVLGLVGPMSVYCDLLRQKV